jgi:hypothetical protein
MSKNTKKAKQAPTPVATGLPSFKPCKSLADVTKDWFDAHKSKDEIITQDFFNIANLLSQNYKTFEFRDVIALTRALDIPTAALAPLFDSWTKELEANNRVECLNLFGEPSWTFK